MAVRHTDLTLKTFTIDGTDFKGDFRSSELGVSLTTADGRGAVRYAKPIETKRTHVAPFSIQVDAVGTTPGTSPDTALTVSVFTVNSVDLLGDFKNFTISLTNSTRDGSGGRDRDTYANFVGGSTLTISGTFCVLKSELFLDMMNVILDDDTADHVFAVSVDYGAEAIGGTYIITQCNLKSAIGDLLMYDMTLQCRGTPTATPGTTFFGRALVGTTTNAVFDLVCDTGAGQYTLTDAIISSLTCTVSESQITSLNGSFILAGKPGWVTST
jgi:hypothetical protein